MPKENLQRQPEQTERIRVGKDTIRLVPPLDEATEKARQHANRMKAVNEALQTGTFKKTTPTFNEETWFAQGAEPESKPSKFVRTPQIRESGINATSVSGEKTSSAIPFNPDIGRFGKAARASQVAEEAANARAQKANRVTEAAWFAKNAQPEIAERPSMHPAPVEGTGAPDGTRGGRYNRRPGYKLDASGRPVAENNAPSILSDMSYARNLGKGVEKSNKGLKDLQAEWKGLQRRSADLTPEILQKQIAVAKEMGWATGDEQQIAAWQNAAENLQRRLDAMTKKPKTAEDWFAEGVKQNEVPESTIRTAPVGKGERTESRIGSLGVENATGSRILTGDRTKLNEKLRATQAAEDKKSAEMAKRLAAVNKFHAEGGFAKVREKLHPETRFTRAEQIQMSHEQLLDALQNLKDALQEKNGISSTAELNNYLDGTTITNADGKTQTLREVMGKRADALVHQMKKMQKETFWSRFSSKVNDPENLTKIIDSQEAQAVAEYRSNPVIAPIIANESKGAVPTKAQMARNARMRPKTPELRSTLN